MILNHYLSGFIIFCAATLTVMSSQAAEAELSTPVKEGSDATLVSETVPGVLSYSSPVDGFQPLTVMDTEVDAAFLEQTESERRGAILLFHDQGNQFESPGVITPLRHYLPEFGWSTMTLSYEFPSEVTIMLSPSLDDVGKSDGVTVKEESTLTTVSNEQRFVAAIEYLKAKNIKQLIFLGHGQGGKLAINLIEKSSLPVAGLVLVGVPAVDSNKLEQLRIPVLDVVGNDDLRGVKPSAKKRHTAFENKQQSHALREIIGAGHHFYGFESMLKKIIRGWLKTHFEQGNH